MTWAIVKLKLLFLQNLVLAIQTTAAFLIFVLSLFGVQNVPLARKSNTFYSLFVAE